MEAAGTAVAWRLDLTKAQTRTGELSWEEAGIGLIACDPHELRRIHGDVIVARKDVPTTYHLSVVVDDALQNITHVTRGQDLYSATDIHRLLQTLLELPAPLYHHHKLLTGADGRKLSKSHKDRSLTSLRADAMSPDDIRRMAGLK